MVTCHKLGAGLKIRARACGARAGWGPYRAPEGTAALTKNYLGIDRVKKIEGVRGGNKEPSGPLSRALQALIV